MIFSFNALEVFSIAIKIEENGKAFYEKALSRMEDAGVKELFKDLAVQEADHKRRFEELKAQLPVEAGSGAVWDPDNELDLYLKMTADQHIFGPNSDVEAAFPQAADPIGALKAAIGFEKDSVIFFLTMQDATDEEKGRRFISQLVKEEQEHLRRLSMELRKRTSGS